MRLVINRLLISLLIITQVSYAQKSQNVYELSYNPGTIFAHSDFVQNTKGANPKTIQFFWGKIKQSDSFINYYKCYAQLGLQVSYSDFNTPILGKGVSAAYIMKPIFYLNDKYCLFTKMGIGLSYLTAPHDSFTHPENQTYSLPVNVYLEFTAGVQYKLSKYWSTSLQCNFLHHSNGGINKPNRGINVPGIGFGLVYHPQPLKLKRMPFRILQKNISAKKQWNEIKFFSGYKNIVDSYYQRKMNVIAGLSFKHVWQYNQFHNLSVGFEATYDSELENLQLYFKKKNNPYLFALTVGHEFSFKKFLFTQDIGYYLTNDLSRAEARFKQYQRLMHKWDISYKLHRNWLIGFGVKAHLHIADFINMHVSYRW